MFGDLIGFVRNQYRTDGPIPLHAPVFAGDEKRYLAETIDNTFVSSVGAFVDRFERDIEHYTGSQRAVATVNGTAALHLALKLSGVGPGDLVISQALTFVATANAIAYCGAAPVFIDVDRETLGLSPDALEAWLADNASRDDDGICRHRRDGRPVRACMPMHTFGHPVRLDELAAVCDTWGIVLVEDAAESLGSFYKGRHTGTVGRIGALSFNGNKIITTGGGGMVLADDQTGARAKHLSTTAKIAHAYEYRHDAVGYNYRLPNLNAALGCAQLEQLDRFIDAKRALAKRYKDFLTGAPLAFVTEPEHCRSNYWLNAVVCEDRPMRDRLLAETNEAGVMTRPIWTLMTDLAMFANAERDDLSQSRWLEERVVNLPSSVPPEPA